MSTAIRIESVSKLYRLGTVGTGTIAHDLNRWWHQIRGKEDPYAKVGQVNDRTKAAKSEEHGAKSDATSTLNSSPSALRSGAPGPDYVWALRDINLEVQQGEILGIIGRNGAGKSTLLKLLSRVTAPTTGAIKTRGRIASLLEVGTGFHPEMTGRENIYMNGAILGMRRHEITRQLDEIVEFSGCAKYLDTPVKRYSSGMTVRLGFAVAAHLDPEILIVDEVLAVGDVEFQSKCLDKMKNVSSSGKTVLFVSHNMASIRTLTNRAIVLSNGQVMLQGTTAEAISQYLAHNLEERSRDRNVASLTRAFSGLSRALQITELSVAGSTTVPAGTRVPFELTVRANSDNEPFELGITIFRSDFTAVGSTFSARIPEIAPGHSESFSFVLPTELLAPGDYHCSLSISSTRSYGQHTFDSLADVLPFSIEQNTLARPWNNAWGSLQLPTVISTEVSQLQ